MIGRSAAVVHSAAGARLASATEARSPAPSSIRPSASTCRRTRTARSRRPLRESSGPLARFGGCAHAERLAFRSSSRADDAEQRSHAHPHCQSRPSARLAALVLKQLWQRRGLRRYRRRLKLEHRRRGREAGSPSHRSPGPPTPPRDADQLPRRARHERVAGARDGLAQRPPRRGSARLLDGHGRELPAGAAVHRRRAGDGARPCARRRQHASRQHQLHDRQPSAGAPGRVPAQPRRPPGGAALQLGTRSHPLDGQPHDARAARAARRAI